jgi:ABC-type Zn uptake system ZnuABC Zn-binding protein ZnuA
MTKPSSKLHRSLCYCGVVLLMALTVLSTYADGPEPEELEPVSLGQGEKLKVVATTSIVADIVGQIGDGVIDLITLLPVGVDPHAFELTPRDVATVADAHVVIANGAGLEAFLQELLENAGGDTSVVYASRGVTLRGIDASPHEPGTERQEHETEEPLQEGTDPHTWTTPVNAMVFVRNIVSALSALDPTNSEAYEANAKAYTTQLEEIDDWVQEMIERIPEEHRKLVTDHTVFGYYTDRYGLEQIGAVIPVTSSAAQPSARELAALEETIKEHDVKAIFAGNTVNPSLSEQVANDSGTQLVMLYTGSLGIEGSGVENYLEYLRYNTNAIVSALK